MKNKLFSLFITVSMLVNSAPLFAQSIEEIDAKMNEIKLDENMIYGSDFNDNEDIAYGNALDELVTYANELRAYKGLGIIKLADIQPFVKEMKYAEGNRHTVLVYIPVSRMYSLGSKSHAGIDSTKRYPNDILETLCNQDNWIEIKGFLTNFKRQGKIKENGYCTTYSEVPDDAYSILIDEMYGILAILSPKNMPERINYRTNQPDSETNYSNCKVIVWYK